MDPRMNPEAKECTPSNKTNISDSAQPGQLQAAVAVQKTNSAPRRILCENFRDPDPAQEDPHDYVSEAEKTGCSRESAWDYFWHIRLLTRANLFNPKLKPPVPSADSLETWLCYAQKQSISREAALAWYTGPEAYEQGEGVRIGLDLTCYQCKATGHSIFSCPDFKPERHKRCDICFKWNHTAKKCRLPHQVHRCEHCGAWDHAIEFCWQYHHPPCRFCGRVGHYEVYCSNRPRTAVLPPRIMQASPNREPEHLRYEGAKSQCRSCGGFSHTIHSCPILDSVKHTEGLMDQNKEAVLPKPICTICGALGHSPDSCNHRLPLVDPTSGQSTVAQLQLSSRARDHHGAENKKVKPLNGMQCFYCKDSGHLQSECPQLDQSKRSRCELCGMWAHTTQNCPFAVL